MKENFEQYHSAKHIETLGGPFETFKHPFCCKISKNLNNFEKLSKSLKKGKSHSVEKSGKRTILLWNGSLFHVRDFGCVQN